MYEGPPIGPVAAAVLKAWQDSEEAQVHSQKTESSDLQCCTHSTGSCWRSCAQALAITCHKAAACLMSACCLSYYVVGPGVHRTGGLAAATARRLSRCRGHAAC